jgi:hypothetical protein
MTVTFGNRPAASNLDLVRILINDTTGKLSDESINYFLTSEASVWYAAAMCCDVIAGQSGPVSSMQVGDLSLTYGQSGQTDYKSLARQLRVRGSRGAVPFAGGLTLSDKDAEETDSQRVPPAFRIGIHDDVGSETT